MTRKPTFLSNSAPPSFSSGLLQFAASAIVNCVSGLPRVMSKLSDEEKDNFYSSGRVASCDLPLSRTDKCKISTMMYDTIKIITYI